VTRLALYLVAQATLDVAAKAVDRALWVRDLVQDLATLMAEEGGP
jgi:hypothetical protein